MNSREFLRRYERVPQVNKAELIEGVVYLGSRATTLHGRADGIIQGWLGTYANRYPETEVFANTTVILDVENTVQPDAFLRRRPEHGRLAGGCDTAKVLAALTGHEPLNSRPPEYSVKSDDTFIEEWRL